MPVPGSVASKPSAKVNLWSRKAASPCITVSHSVEGRSEEHTSELQSQSNLVCRLLLEKKKKPRLRIIRRGQAMPWDRHRTIEREHRVHLALHSVIPWVEPGLALTDACRCAVAGADLSA